MGNCFALHKLIKRSQSRSQSTTTRHENVSRIMKATGKILDDTRPVIIKGCGNNGDHFFPACSLGWPIRVASDHDSPTSVSMDNTSGTKRIEMILTKQQLQELVFKKISVEEICLMAIQNVSWCERLNSLSRWQPGLQTIPEESE
ncbi:unnamed protein product [Dovyalis caffra]|uniref:Uncharacterized protein n=1 Tax=Dovyalis caffra TaxID=77055 RepID=A0AAV1SWI3_9ROSI|nr:unnamed protein product [Dovyalis caffra]